MLREYKTQALLGIWGGFLAFGIGYLISSSGTPPGPANSVFGFLIMVGSYALFSSGCFMYARGKGYPWGFGFLALLGPLGLLLLYVLKDRSKIILKLRSRQNR